MKILIVAHFTSILSESGNNRFNYIADLLGERKDNEVELITTSFSHGNKKQRGVKKELLDALPYKLTMLYEPGYKKNVCLKRFYSHYILGRNLKKYLNKMEEKLDIIYTAVPSLNVAKVAAKYAKRNKIRFIIDVQDLWPEAFKMVFNIPVLSDIIFYPIKKQADYIYKNADDIIAVSETYRDRVVKVNKKYKNKLSVFLGTNLKDFDKAKEKYKTTYQDNIIRLAYIGTLGHSYDLKCAMDALSILKRQGVTNIKFVIMGNGPLKEEFEKYSKEKDLDCEFTGLLPYNEMVGRLGSCDIAINPIMHNAAQSIINKVGDYAAAGLPVISTQECQEYRKLIEEYQIGFNCQNGNSVDMANKIKELIINKELREEMGINNRKLAEEKFDREKTYFDIIKLIVGKDKLN